MKRKKSGSALQGFYTAVTAAPKCVLAVFLLLTVVCAVLGSMVAVNYDINDYLPSDSPSTVAIDVMEDEFDGGIPNVRVMIQNVSIPEALSYKQQLQNIEGVTEVTWLDDSVEITAPLETADQETVESYYKNGAALYSVTLEEEHILDGVEAIRSTIEETRPKAEFALTGSAVSTAAATTNTVAEVAKVAAFAVAFVFLVLILTTSSWAEPVIILLGLGVAILLNKGTNLIFGEISFVSNAAGAILQLAVSLDYSVFLLHRFEESRESIPDVREAMVDALCKSTSSILSSGLTTVIGFAALCLMRFRIGPDLGMVLAKGVALSLLCVFVMMPDLILCVYKLLDKTRHRSFVPNFGKAGKVISRLMIPFACVQILLIAPCYLASNANSYYYGASHIFGENTELGADTALIENTFGKSDTYVLLVPKGDKEMELALSAELRKFPEVTDIISYVDTVGAEIPEAYLDDATLSQLYSENYSRMVIQLDTDQEGESTFALVENIRSTAQQFCDEYHLAGNGVSSYDLMDTVTADMVKVNLIAVGAVFIVLLLTMKSLTLPLILVLSIETAIWLNLSIPYFAGQTLFYIAYLIISSVQLGATVDYAILLTDRYLENRKTMHKQEAISSALASCMVSILTSGSVLTVVGFLLGKFSTHGLLAQLGMLLGRGTLCSLALVTLALPGLLYVFDGLIRVTTKGAVFYEESIQKHHFRRSRHSADSQPGYAGPSGK